MINGDGIVCNCEDCHGVEVSKMKIHFMLLYGLKYCVSVPLFFVELGCDAHLV